MTGYGHSSPIEQPVHTSYLICATPRSGSYLLCEALTNTGLAGHPAEYFWREHEPLWAARWGTSDHRDYIAAAIRETSTLNGVFGMKTVWEYMDDFAQTLRVLPGRAELPLAALLDSVFPGLRYISITRRDKVRQAISNFKALRTGIWMWKQDEPSPAGHELAFDFHAIDSLVQRIAMEEAAWRAYFAGAGIVPLTVVYEDLVDAYEATAVNVLEYLGISVPADLTFSPRYLQRQADAETDAWAERYRAYLGEMGRSRADVSGRV